MNYTELKSKWIHEFIKETNLPEDKIGDNLPEQVLEWLAKKNIENPILLPKINVDNKKFAVWKTDVYLYCFGNVERAGDNEIIEYCSSIEEARLVWKFLYYK